MDPSHIGGAGVKPEGVSRVSAEMTEALNEPPDR